jgi:hypothetical protein
MRNDSRRRGKAMLNIVKKVRRLLRNAFFLTNRARVIADSWESRIYTEMKAWEQATQDSPNTS